MNKNPEAQIRMSSIALCLRNLQGTCPGLLQAGFLVPELESLLLSLPRVRGLVPEVEVSPLPLRGGSR